MEREVVGVYGVDQSNASTTFNRKWEVTSATDSRIRVLLVGPSLDIVGGQAVQAKRLLDGFKESEVVEASFLAVNPKLTGVWGACQRLKYVRTVVTSVAYIASLLRKIPQYDVVHAFSASYYSYLLAPLPAMIVARFFGKPTLLNYRSGEADDHLTNWPLTAKPTMRRFATMIVAPSGYLVDVFGKHGLTAVSIFNFVPIDKLPYRKRSNLRPKFFSNRNHEALYNVACTIRAFAIIRRRFPAATLTVAGDGAERKRLEELAVELSVADAVTFIGRVDPVLMGVQYDAADIYLNSPNIDNMPGSIVEAFACGLPVVSTNAGGIPYIVDHERTGLLSACDDHNALAASAIRMLEDPSFAEQIATNARAECEAQYVWPSVKSRWEALYGNLVAGRQ